jgi:hypothetical protein
MTPQLQKIYQDLNQITPIERWQVVEHLLAELKSPTVAPTAIPQPHLSAQEIFTATRGSWGNRSLDEIDAELAHQRQLSSNPLA